MPGKKKPPVDMLQATKHRRGKHWRIKRIIDVKLLAGEERFQRSAETVKRFKCAEPHCNVVIHTVDQVIEKLEKILSAKELEIFEYTRDRYDGRVWYVLQVRWHGTWRTATMLNDVLARMLVNHETEK
jgi:hypothetical protein